MTISDSGYLGLRTVVYFVTDLDGAAKWYTSVLGFGPYCNTPYYVGFNVGGFELGLHPCASEKTNEEATNVAYWGVTDIRQEQNRLMELGATTRKAVQDAGGGIKFAEVIDPFGNILGIIENPHFPNTIDPADFAD